MFLQQLVNGLMLGAVYTLVALAFSLVMGILGILNIAVAEIFMLGAFLGISALIAGWPAWMAVLVALGGAAVVSIFTERLAYRPLRDAPEIMPLLSTLGISIFLQNLALNVWGSDPLQLTSGTLNTRLSVGAVSLSYAQVLILATTVSIVIALGWVVRRTWLGRALRVVAEDREAASLLGVPATTVTVSTFVISGLLAGTGGLLIGVHYSAVTPFLGIDVALKGIAVMVIGGVRNIWGALAAGPLIGVVEVMAVGYGESVYRDVFTWGLLIVVLLIRPEGLFTTRSRVEGRF